MAAQILAVIIFIVMFGLIIWDHIERHIARMRASDAGAGVWRLYAQ